jgi:hypothetical protein
MQDDEDEGSPSQDGANRSAETPNGKIESSAEALRAVTARPSFPPVQSQTTTLRGQPGRQKDWQRHTVLQVKG